MTKVTALRTPAVTAKARAELKSAFLRLLEALLAAAGLIWLILWSSNAWIDIAAGITFVAVGGLLHAAQDHYWQSRKLTRT